MSSIRHALLPLLASLAFLLALPLHAADTKPAAKSAVRTDFFGDPLPPGVRFRLGTVRLRHDGYDALALTWLPDGRTLASAGWDGTVRLWQIPGGKLIAKRDNLEGVVFSPDGRSLACGEGSMSEKDEERAIRIVDVATGKTRRRIQVSNNRVVLFNFTPGHCNGLFSPDGKTLAVNEGSGVRLYSVDSGKELRFLKEKLLEFGHPLRFSPDSRTLIVAGDKGVFRWTISTGEKTKILEDLDRPAFSFAFSSDGKMLAAAVSLGTLTLRSYPAGKELHRLDLNEDSELYYAGGHDVLAFSPDGKLLASSNGGTIRLWNPATGKLVRRFEGHWGDYILDFAFSPDGSLLASAGRDGAVIVWEVQERKSPRPLTGVGHWLKLVGLAADRQSLLTRSAEGSLTVWDVHDGRRLRTLTNGEDGVRRFRFGPEAGRTLALLWKDVESGPYRQMFNRNRLQCSAFSPDNTMLAVGGREGILLLRKTARGIERRLLDDEDRPRRAKAQGINIPVNAVTFSPDGRTLAANLGIDRLFLWDLRTGRPRHILSFPSHGESYRLLDFSPDGRLLAVSDRRALYLVETASGQRIRELPLGERWVGFLAFAPDNRTLAVGDVDIHLWDWPTGKIIHTLEGHRDGVDKLLFSPDSSFLLSGSSDNTVLCWDVAAFPHRRPSPRELSAAQLTALWTDLASTDARRAQQAVATLIQAPATAPPFLEKALPPASSEQMAAVTVLLADLDSEQFNRRERASRQLVKRGEDIAPALRKALADKPSLEMRKRILTLLDTIGRQPLSREWLRTVRALQVLETIGTPQARTILEGLSRGASGARLTEEAKAALQRLGRRAPPRSGSEEQP